MCVSFQPICLVHDLTLVYDILLQIKEAARELCYQPDPTFCLKVSQLREIFEVRWSVFLLGPAGCGKSAIWRTLLKAQNNHGEKTVRLFFTLRKSSTAKIMRDCSTAGLPGY